MENNEDIKIVEEFIKYFEAEAISKKYRRNISITVGEEDIEAIENLLSRLKTAERELEIYKKLEEEIKQKANYCLEIPDEHCKKYTTAECGKCIIEWARKKVEDE